MTLRLRLDGQILSCVSCKDLEVVDKIGGGQSGIVFACRCTRPGLPDPAKLYVPTGHWVQLAAAPPLKDPAGHSEAERLPVPVGQPYPAGQGTHVVAS